MTFNAKDDFVNDFEIQEESELEAEAKQADEEDNGYDHASLIKKDINTAMTPEEEDAFENERQGGKCIFDDEPEEEY